MLLDIATGPITARIRTLRNDPTYYRLTLDYPRTGDTPDRVIAAVSEILRNAKQPIPPKRPTGASDEV